MRSEAQWQIGNAHHTNIDKVVLVIGVVLSVGGN